MPILNYIPFLFCFVLFFVLFCFLFLLFLLLFLLFFTVPLNFDQPFPIDLGSDLEDGLGGKFTQTVHTISIIVTLGGEGPETRYIRRVLFLDHLAFYTSITSLSDLSLC